VLDVEFELPQQDGYDSDDNSLDDEVKAKHLFKMPIAERVIRIVLKRKKGWINLAYDMQKIASRIQSINKLVEFIPRDYMNFPYLLDVLTKQHHNSFYQLLQGLEQVADHYLREENDDYFNKTNEALQLALKKQKSFVMVSHNAFYITQASVNPLHISTATMTPEDVYRSFEQIRKPVVDEEALTPK
jgi:hypothetical protein